MIAARLARAPDPPSQELGRAMPIQDRERHLERLRRHSHYPALALAPPAVLGGTGTATGWIRTTLIVVSAVVAIAGAVAAAELILRVVRGRRHGDHVGFPVL